MLLGSEITSSDETWPLISKRRCDQNRGETGRGEHLMMILERRCIPFCVSVEKNELQALKFANSFKVELMCGMPWQAVSCQFFFIPSSICLACITSFLATWIHCSTLHGGCADLSLILKEHSC